jgi:hypothetical protein
LESFRQPLGDVKRTVDSSLPSSPSVHWDRRNDVDLQFEQLVAEPLPGEFGQGMRHDALAIGLGTHYELSEEAFIVAERDRALEAEFIAAAVVAG